MDVSNAAAVAFSTNLQAALADRGLSIRKAASLTNTPRATLQRQFHSGAFRPETEAALLELVDSPATRWGRCVSCPAGAGWPPYPRNSDPHPAACLLDAKRSLRELLELLDDAPAPSQMTEEQKTEILQRAMQAIQDTRRLTDSLRPKHH